MAPPYLGRSNHGGMVRNRGRGVQAEDEWEDKCQKGKGTLGTCAVRLMLGKCGAPYPRAPTAPFERILGPSSSYHCFAMGGVGLSRAKNPATRENTTHSHPHRRVGHRQFKSKTRGKMPKHLFFWRIQRRVYLVYPSIGDGGGQNPPAHPPSGLGKAARH